MKLSRILSNQNGVSRKQANGLLSAGLVQIDGNPCREPAREVSRFSTVTCQGHVIQAGVVAHYLMLYKPAGILSATTDATHSTVMDLVDSNHYPELHIAGRLDRASTGLMLLTNDGQWSRTVTEPASEKPKVYQVTTAYDFSPDTVDRFAAGIWFEYEQLTTRPATLEPLSGRVAKLTLYEGRYHQIKRMFHAVGNRVVALHREQIGDIRLDPTLAPGDYRPLTQKEIDCVVPR